MKGVFFCPDLNSSLDNMEGTSLICLQNNNLTIIITEHSDLM